MGADLERAVREAFRVSRVAFLPGVLRTELDEFPFDVTWQRPVAGRPQQSACLRPEGPVSLGASTLWDSEEAQLAVEFLRDTAPRQAAVGWYDEDLLYAVVTRRPEAWVDTPSSARELRDTVNGLTDLSRYVKRELEAFLATRTEDVKMLNNSDKW
ncbi:hypothetical protein [Streptomyces sp. WM6386]|uniref:hypothetical protein n=1 Tax=Streptomyces sp. WM6386 TaxID=1415558 RepID=UPI000619E896|nr:hypothetical protein [Streptomyces sp. WM6386]KKD05233.1 hypothetical protein TN53_25785 [Streptomyces sp. WM6386]